MYAVFGVLYGVLLAFTIIGAWELFAGAERKVMAETTTVIKLWRDAGAFPAGIASEIHRDLVDYSASVQADRMRGHRRSTSTSGRRSIARSR